MIGDIVKLSGSILFVIIVVSFLLSTSFAQNSQNNRFIMTMSESEVSELDFRRELLFRSRAEFNVNSEKQPEELLAVISQKVIDTGWTNNWQQKREGVADWHIANYSATGGGNLRLELNKTSAEGYRLLLYRY